VLEQSVGMLALVARLLTPSVGVQVRLLGNGTVMREQFVT
jgi:hypothetical protein